MFRSKIITTAKMNSMLPFCALQEKWKTLDKFISSGLPSAVVK